MKNIIRIKKASFYAYHGVFQSEQNVGGKFEADIVIYTDFRFASEKDKLENTIDYESVYKILYEVAIAKKYYLIEALAAQVTDELFKRYETIEKLEVRIRKNNPPIGGVVESVEVEIIKDKNEYLKEWK